LYMFAEKKIINKNKKKLCFVCFFREKKQQSQKKNKQIGYFLVRWSSLNTLT